MAKAYSNDLRERVIKSYESGASKKEIGNIFVIDIGTLNRLTRKYKENGRSVCLCEDESSWYNA